MKRPGSRTILWAGTPCHLVVLAQHLFSTEVISVESGPGLAEEDFGELMGWLTAQVPRGETVDIVYQKHWLQVETFPGLNPGELEAAVKAKLRREAIVPVDRLVSLMGRHAGTGLAQGAYAAVGGASHAALCQALEGSGLVVGRIGFSGQLAFCAFARHSTAGEWCVLDGVAFFKRTLMIKGPDGQVLVAPLPGQAEIPGRSPAGAVSDDRGAGGDSRIPENLKILIPRMTPAQEPLDIASRFRHRAERLHGKALPLPLSVIIPLFVGDRQWRIASREDIEYPYYLSQATWGFVVAAVLMVLYSGHLYGLLKEQRETAPVLAQLKARKEKLGARQRTLDGDQKDLAYLEANVVGVSVELYDNAEWLRFLARIRDRHAPELLFETLGFTSAALRITGQHASVDPILSFFKRLVRSVGEDAARLEGITRQPDGKHSFAMTIDRATGVPPPVQD